MSRIALVAALAANRVIGANGRIPWRISEDMRRFKSLTLGKPCIMGRKTWESLPKKPLPERLNIVLTRDVNYAPPGAEIVHSLSSAIARADQDKPEEIAVIGGADIYRAALPLADRLYLTEVAAAFAGDTWFPDFDRNEWREIARRPHKTPDGLAYAFVTLERVSTSEHQP